MSVLIRIMMVNFSEHPEMSSSDMLHMFRDYMDSYDQIRLMMMMLLVMMMMMMMMMMMTMTMMVIMLNPHGFAGCLQTLPNCWLQSSPPPLVAVDSLIQQVFLT